MISRTSVYIIQSPSCLKSFVVIITNQESLWRIVKPVGIACYLLFVRGLHFPGLSKQKHPLNHFTSVVLLSSVLQKHELFVPHSFLNNYFIVLKLLELLAGSFCWVLKELLRECKSVWDGVNSPGKSQVKCARQCSENVRVQRWWSWYLNDLHINHMCIMIYIHKCTLDFNLSISC